MSNNHLITNIYQGKNAGLHSKPVYYLWQYRNSVIDNNPTGTLSVNVMIEFTSSLLLYMVILV